MNFRDGMFAEQVLENAILRDVAAKNGDARCEAEGDGSSRERGDPVVREALELDRTALLSDIEVHDGIEYSFCTTQPGRGKRRFGALAIGFSLPQSLTTEAERMRKWRMGHRSADSEPRPARSNDVALFLDGLHHHIGRRIGNGWEA